MNCTAAQLLAAYRQALKDGKRPECLLECSVEEGGLVRYPLRNSRAITEAFVASLSPKEEGFYFTFDIGQDPLEF